MGTHLKVRGELHHLFLQRIYSRCERLPGIGRIVGLDLDNNIIAKRVGMLVGGEGHTRVPEELPDAMKWESETRGARRGRGDVGGPGEEPWGNALLGQIHGMAWSDRCGG